MRTTTNHTHSGDPASAAADLAVGGQQLLTVAMTGRRTKRRYAHEIYPHAEEWQVRPLALEVPYLLAMAVGASVFGTGWMEDPARGRHRVAEAMARIEIALLADALHQGMTGDEAWSWVACGGDGQAQHELAFERACHYGVRSTSSSPTPAGPSPSTTTTWPPPEM